MSEWPEKGPEGRLRREQGKTKMAKIAGRPMEKCPRPNRLVGGRQFKRLPADSTKAEDFTGFRTEIPVNRSQRAGLCVQCNSGQSDARLTVDSQQRSGKQNADTQGPAKIKGMKKH